MLFGHCVLSIDHLLSLSMNKDITLTDVLNHMQIHAGEFRKGFLQVYKRIDDLEEKLTNRIDSVEQSLTGEIRGIDDLDFRVQDLEDEKLPKRISRIEKKLQMQS